MENNEKDYENKEMDENELSEIFKELQERIDDALEIIQKDITSLKEALDTTKIPEEILVGYIQSNTKIGKRKIQLLFEVIRNPDKEKIKTVFLQYLSKQTGIPIRKIREILEKLQFE